MSLPLTIVGVSARAAAQAARRAGFAPHCIDLFADLDTRAAGTTIKVTSYPHGFLAALRRSPDSAWMYTGGLENYPRLVDQLARERPLLGNVGGSLRAVRDPKHLARVVLDAGYLFPTVEGRTARLPRVSKPLRSGGGRKMRIVPAGDDRPVPRGWYQQRFIEGIPVSALYVADGETSHLIGTSRQLIGNDFGLNEPFCYAGSISPLQCTDSINREFAELGPLLARQFGLRGVFGIDFVLQGSQLWVLEVNPRLTASAEVVERATGCNPIALHVAAFSTQLPPASATSQASGPNAFHGKAIVYAEVASIAGDRFAYLVGDLNQGHPHGIADLPLVGTRFEPGEPVATVFAEGSSEMSVLQTLKGKCEHALSMLEKTL